MSRRRKNMKDAISMDVCFFCDKERGLVVYQIPEEAEAPTRIVTNYEPCDECKEKMAQGVTLIEVQSTNNGTYEIQKGLWPTGRWSVVTQEAADRMFCGANSTRKTLLVDDDLYSMLLGKRINEEVRHGLS